MPKQSYHTHMMTLPFGILHGKGCEPLEGGVRAHTYNQILVLSSALLCISWVIIPVTLYSRVYNYLTTNSWNPNVLKFTN